MTPCRCLPALKNSEENVAAFYLSRGLSSSNSGRYNNFLLTTMTRCISVRFVLSIICLVAVSLISVSLMAHPVVAQDAFQPQPSVELPDALDRVLRDYEQAWAANDAEALAALFTEEGFVPSSAGWIKGRDAITKKYASTGGDLRLRALDYQIADSVGFIVGAYGYGEEAAEVDRGNFILALKKSAQGTWLIVADLDKGNQGEP